MKDNQFTWSNDCDEELDISNNPDIINVLLSIDEFIELVESKTRPIMKECDIYDNRGV